MTIEQMKIEIELSNAKREAVKKANSVSCDAPLMPRSFTYRTSSAIKTSDVNL